jgi:hypothetical protein
MKLQSTADGLKAAPVNPHPSVEVYYRAGKPVINKKWAEFNKNNPALDLTTHMPGNTVFEGVEVWQTRNGLDLEWFNCIDNKPHFIDERPDLYRRCYQPLEVKEQVREEAEEKRFDYDHLPLSKADQQKLYWDANAKEKMSKLLGIDNLTEASNPELGVESEATKMARNRPRHWLPDVVSLMEDYHKQQVEQQGLVSMEDVERILDVHYMGNTPPEILVELKTLKQ